MKYKINYIICCFLLVACTKETDPGIIANKLISGKTWYLEYIHQDNQTKSFVGKSTYFIQFKLDGSTIDSDGITGTFKIEKKEQQLILSVTGITQSGIQANYAYQIDEIGFEMIIISYTQNNLLIQKKFTTNY